MRKDGPPERHRRQLTSNDAQPNMAKKTHGKTSKKKRGKKTDRGEKTNSQKGGGGAPRGGTAARDWCFQDTEKEKGKVATGTLEIQKGGSILKRGGKNWKKEFGNSG